MNMWKKGGHLLCSDIMATTAAISSSSDIISTFTSQPSIAADILCLLTNHRVCLFARFLELARTQRSRDEVHCAAADPLPSSSSSPSSSSAAAAGRSTSSPVPRSRARPQPLSNPQSQPIFTTLLLGFSLHTGPGRSTFLKSYQNMLVKNKNTGFLFSF